MNTVLFSPNHPGTTAARSWLIVISCTMWSICTMWGARGPVRFSCIKLNANIQLPSPVTRILADSAWRPLQLPVEKPWSMWGGPFGCLLHKQGVENPPFTLYGLYFWHFRQPLVWRSILWSEALTIQHLLMSGCGQGHEPTENVSIKLWLKFPVLAPSRCENTA